MTCHSGGSLDVYIEPVFPKPHLVVFGHSVVAQTLCLLARAIHFRVTAVAPEAGSQVSFDADRVLDRWAIDDVPATPQTFIVVATQGEGDEEALARALAHGGGYVAFVASRKKSAVVFDALRAQGVDADRIAAVKSPAGLDIKARFPEEIAVSILAEIIQHKQTAPPAEVAPAPDLVSEHLEIEGMSCAHCVHNVEKALGALEGVEVVAVEIGTADVRYDLARVDKEVLVGAVQARGYTIRNGQ